MPEVQKWSIILVLAPNQYILTSTFLRFQEYYESPEFRGRVFTLEEYMDWYASQNDGKFTYFEDWNGFNISDRVINEVFRRFETLSRKEIVLLNALRSTGIITQPYYVVGLVKDKYKPIDLKHELIHGLCYTYPTLRTYLFGAFDRYCVANARASAFRNKLIKILFDWGYAGNVVTEEAIAYIMTGLVEELRDLPKKQIEELRRSLLDKFRQYFGFNIRTARLADLLPRIHVVEL